MKQIASPSTAMNLANGTLHTKLSFLQEKGSRQSPRQTAVGVPQIPALVQHVQDAAHVFFACVAKYGAQSSLLQEAQAPMQQISERKPFKVGQAPMRQISEPKTEKTIDPMPTTPVDPAGNTSASAAVP